MVNKDLNKLKEDFLSSDFTARERALKKLVKLKAKQVLNLFISGLKNSDRRIQASSAAALRIMRDSRSIKPLLASIKKPSNKGYTGSFVYALQTHNCENFLIPLVNIALSSGYESQTHALEILASQKFKCSPNDIGKIKSMIRKYSGSQYKCDEWEVLIEELSASLDRIEKEINNLTVKKVSRVPRNLK